MINLSRLAQRFIRFVQIDSVSKQEKKLALVLEHELKAMGAKIVFDSAKDTIGSDCSNLVAKFKGTINTPPIFLCAHMDTVEPGKGVKPVFKDGIFASEGQTILGADDKSAIAIILEIMDVILENKLDYPPIEIVFTVCEEIGLLGAKNFDFSLIDSKNGYVLDSTAIEGIVVKAPFAKKLDIKVYGKAAHAGAAPEKGVSAISIASKAIALLELGRIDKETTCNLGTIKGGFAPNIVPDFVQIIGEVRSHDKVKLEKVTNNIVNTFYDTAARCKKKTAKIKVKVEEDFSNTNIDSNHKVVKLAEQAASNLGLSMKKKIVGGGSDANIFFQKGIIAGVIGTGMKDIHTVNESIDIKEMEKTSKIVLEILRLYINKSE